MVGEHAVARAPRRVGRGASGGDGLLRAQRGPASSSAPVRELRRRRTASVGGEQRLSDGTSVPLSVERLASPLDGALRASPGRLCACSRHGHAQTVTTASGRLFRYIERRDRDIVRKQLRVESRNSPATKRWLTRERVAWVTPNERDAVTPGRVRGASPAFCMSVPSTRPKIAWRHVAWARARRLPPSRLSCSRAG